MNRHIRSLINARFCPFVIPNTPFSLFELANEYLSPPSLGCDRPALLDFLFDSPLQEPTSYPLWQSPSRPEVVPSHSPTCVFHGNQEFPIDSPLMQFRTPPFGHKWNILPPSSRLLAAY